MKRRKMLSILLCAALLFSTAPAVPALAADEVTDGAAEGTQVGTLTVRGGTLGEAFTYDEEKHVLTIKGDADLTISGKTTQDRIVVAEDATAKVILNGVSIIHPETGKVNYDDKTDANAGIGALTLNDGASLTLTLSGENTLKSGHGRAGIFVPANASLTIDGAGSLDVTGGDKAAGIGGDLWHNAGTITIKSGTITATGGTDSAGIGGAHANDGLSQQYGGFKSITIEGGNVTATASGNAAGIGTGCWAKNGGAITITDATVSASTPGNAAGGSCAAIGQGYNGGQNLTTPCIIAINGSLVSVSNINGEAIATGGTDSPTLNYLAIDGSVGTVRGTWTVSEDMTIEEGQSLMVPQDGVLTIADDVTLTNKGVLIAHGAVNGDGKIVNKGYMMGDFSGVTVDGTPASSSISYLDAEGEQQTCSTFSFLSDEMTTWTEDWYVALGNVTIDQRVTVTGDVHLILADGATVEVPVGIQVSKPYSLAIYAQSTGDEKGALRAQAAEVNAAIGGGYREAIGDITIAGGAITAYSSQSGIGTGQFGSGGTILITGGDIQATGYDGAGIGSGWSSKVDTTTITGGDVTASSGRGAGIGGGYCSGAGTITITGGHVIAKGGANGEFGAAGIGGGAGNITMTPEGTFATGAGKGGTVTISGGIVEANGSQKAPAIGGAEGSSSDGAFVPTENGRAVIIVDRLPDDYVPEDWQGIIFLGSAGQVYGNTVLSEDLSSFTDLKTLTISEDASLMLGVGGKLPAALTTTPAEYKLIPEIVLEGPKEITADGRPVAFEEDGFTLAYAGETEPTVTWHADADGMPGDALSEAPSEAGTYWVQASVAETDDLAANSVAWQFVIKEEAVEEPDEPSQPSGPSTPVYPSNPDGDKPGVEVTEPEHGTVTVDKEDPAAGETVTITPTPDEGYAVDEVIVRDEDGEKIPVSDNGDGSWSYEQPDGDVTIEVTFTETAPTTPVSEFFIDVAPDAWYTGAVQFAYDRGLMTGTGADTFSPDATTTRAMIVAILHRLEGEPAAAAGTTFDDVAADAWYADAVAWAADADIVNG